MDPTSSPSPVEDPPRFVESGTFSDSGGVRASTPPVQRAITPSNLPRHPNAPGAGAFMLMPISDAEVRSRILSNDIVHVPRRAAVSPPPIVSTPTVDEAAPPADPSARKQMMRNRSLAMMSPVRNSNIMFNAHDVDLMDHRVRDVIIKSDQFRRKHYLRGVLAALALVSFPLSVVDLETYKVNQFLQMLLLIISIVAEVVIYEIYCIKLARLKSGDSLFSDTTLLGSPLAKQMLLEMVVWAVHCPPFLDEVIDALNYLNLLVMLRMYTCIYFIMTTSELNSTFSQALAGMASVTINASFFIRAHLHNKPWVTSLTITGASWVLLSVMFAYAEDHTFNDSFYFVLVTATTIGYGDISPKTLRGRMVTLAAVVNGMVLTGWIVLGIHNSLQLNVREHKLLKVLHKKDAATAIHLRAGHLLQLALRLNLAKKKKVPHHISALRTKLGLVTRKFRAERLNFRDLKEEDKSKTVPTDTLRAIHLLRQQVVDMAVDMSEMHQVMMNEIARLRTEVAELRQQPAGPIRPQPGPRSAFTPPPHSATLAPMSPSST